MQDRITLAEVSRRAGVAPITCSRVLNGSNGRVYIAQATRQRVVEAAQALGYRRHMTAGATRTGRIGAIGLIGISPDHAFPRPMLWGVEEGAAARDLHLVIAQLRHADIDNETQLPRMLRERAVDGLLVYGLGQLSEQSMLADRIAHVDVPVIRLADAADADCVHVNVHAAAADATDRLAKLGHRRIALVQFASQLHPIEHDMREGYRRWLADAGLSPCMMLEPELNARVDRQQAHAHYVLRQKDRPTAVVACGPREAAAFTVAALRLGMKMPEELAVIALADEQVDAGGYTVTTALIPNGQLARTGVRMLCTKVDRADRTLAPQVLHHRILPGQTS